jgi:acetolactate synthase small subunit
MPSQSKRSEEEKIQALLRVLEPYGIKEVVQSGLVDMGAD